MSVLIEACPDNIDPQQIKADLEAIEDVKEVHEFHVWSISADKLALTAHVLSENPMYSIA